MFHGRVERDRARRKPQTVKLEGNRYWPLDRGQRNQPRVFHTF